MIYLPPPSSVSKTARVAIELQQHDREEIQAMDTAALEMSKVEKAASDQEQKNKQVAATIAIGTSFIQAASTVKGQADGVKQGFRADAAKTDIAQNINDSRAGKKPNTKLEDIQLTEKTKLSDRFNDKQRELLAGGKHFERSELTEAGFGDKEADELMDLQKKNGGNGVSADQAADFVVKHKETPKDAEAAKQKALQGEAVKNLCATPERIFAGSGKIFQQETKRYGEIKGTTVGLRDQMYGTAAESRDTARQVGDAASGKRR